MSKYSDFKKRGMWDDAGSYIYPENYESFVITDDGKIGIGINSPEDKLSVAGDAIIGQGVTTGTTILSVGSENAADKRLVISYDNDNNYARINIAGDGSPAGLIIDDGGKIGIGTSNPQNLLDIAGDDPKIRFTDNEASQASWLMGSGNDRFEINEVDGNTRVLVIESGMPQDKFKIDTESSIKGNFTVDSGALQVNRDSAPVLYVNRTTNDGNLVRFERDGGIVGDITVSSSTVSYNEFTGSHTAHTTTSGIKEGMVMVTDYITISGTSNQPEHHVITSSSAEDKRVFGVIGNETPRGNLDNSFDSDEYIIFSIGDGVILVTDTNGDIEIGDYLTTSTRAGYAQKQTSAGLMNYTAAKALQDVTWSEETTDPELGFKWKRIAATFHCA